MCGITGFTGEDHARIDRMTAALVHRGPDGNRTLVTHGVSLGHARLAILDPTPAGDQPMWNEQKTVVIVYNGEIFNYRELKSAERMNCRTGTDTEVILKLYEKYGIDCVKLLRGMFAFGLYDTKTKTWHLARDGSGIKPLFISTVDGKLHFASEMRSLMAGLPQKPALNLRALSQYLRLQYVPGPETLCEGISSLPRGTILSFNEGKEVRKHFETALTPPTYGSKQEFSENFPELMDLCVRDHLVSDKPLGIFLSGGMDSSIVLHHMNHHAAKPIKTFTIRFDARDNEDKARFNRDADLAKLTSVHYGTDHHEILLTAEECRKVYRDSARASDQPNADSVAMAQYVMAREAKKHVDVVLSGAGGDELFGGYPRYRVARILNALRCVPSGMRSLSGGIFGYPKDVLAMSPGPKLAERLLARPLKELLPIVRGNWFNPLTTTELFRDRFSSLTTNHPFGPEGLRASNGYPLTTDPIRAFMEFDRDLWLVDESLRLTDAMTMASGLECRVPFLDPLVIAASHATKSEWHVGYRRTKALLKDTYYPMLPSHLQTLTKASFYPPLAKWLRRECAPLAEEMLEGKRIAEFFDIEKVRTIYNDHKNHVRYGLHTLSSLTQLHHWFETVYDA